jgi:hypothetical protein
MLRNSENKTKIQLFFTGGLVKGVKKMPAETCRMFRTQQYTLNDEPNTTYM